MIRRLKFRNLYKFASEILLDAKTSIPDIGKMRIDIANSQKVKGEGEITINDFEIIKKKVNYAMKD